MNREVLAHYLCEGRSLAEIGALLDRDPSTVGYWVEKHGLAANGRAKYAPRGGLTREQLEPLVDGGLSAREIADRLNRSTSTVWYWLRRHQLQTKRRRRRVADPKPEVIQDSCPRHGRTAFVLEARGAYRCKRCRSECVSRRRRKVKLTLVEEAGGRCLLCGYDRCPWALQFHHVDPAAKKFAVSGSGATMSLDRTRTEAEKCVLLCANCHAEVEAGVVSLP